MTAATLMGKVLLAIDAWKGELDDQYNLHSFGILHIERRYSFSFLSYFVSSNGSAEIEIHFLEDFLELWDLWLSWKQETRNSRIDC